MWNLRNNKKLKNRNRLTDIENKLMVTEVGNKLRVWD